MEDSSSYYEETEAEPPQPSAAPKATGEHLSGQKLEKLEQRASGAGRVQAKGESLPKAERPAPDEAQGDQVARTGESLPVPSQTSGPMEGAAPTENKTKELGQASLSLPRATSQPRQKVLPQREQCQPKLRRRTLIVTTLQNQPKKFRR